MLPLILFSTIILHCVPSLTKNPIILVPGDGGSQAYCDPKKNDDNFLLWVNLRYFLTPGTLAQYFNIEYDPITGELHDSENCNVIFPGWGDTWSIENLDTYKHSSTVYFEALVNDLRTDPFFVSNKTLRGTPFDFRKAPNELPEFNPKMKKLIEETYSNAGEKRVILLGHSLGSLYSLAFLNSVTDQWKQKYIKTFLSVSGPLGGSVKAMKIEASGDNFGIYIRSPVSFRQVQRTLPSLAFLLPDKRLWPPTEKLIITPSTNYSAHDYERFFQDIGYPLGFKLMQLTKSSVDGFVSPTGIDEVYCIHGSSLPTTYQMVYSPPTFYRKGFPDQYPTIVPGDGDGTVHMRSLEVCSSWHGAKHIVLQGAEHLRIVGDPRFLKVIRQVTGAEVQL